MGRNLDPSCKKCRRSGSKLFLKGARCITAKCAIDKRNFPPGPKPLRPAKLTDYGKKLREKQKIRFFYGVSDKQMRIYFQKSLKQKGVTGTNLLTFLERRLDNVVFRIGFSYSRAHARQLIKHGKILVNNHKVDIPSYLIKVGDLIKFVTLEGIVEKKILDLISKKTEKFPEWLYYEENNKQVSVQRFPLREEVDTSVDDQLVVELLKTLVSR